jgi:hypothetical protein
MVHIARTGMFYPILHGELIKNEEKTVILLTVRYSIAAITLIPFFFISGVILALQNVLLLGSHSILDAMNNFSPLIIFLILDATIFIWSQFVYKADCEYFKKFLWRLLSGERP